MKIHFLRHATFLLEVGGRRMLIDPMLSEKDTMDPIRNCSIVKRIPMVDLPINKDELHKMVTTIDAVMVTHTHRDHWDPAAQQLIPKTCKLFCQPPDADTLSKQGFTQVTPIDDTVEWEGVRISRTGGRHGTGETGDAMGPVSGFVVSFGGKKIYIAGDTIWCDEVQRAMEEHRPDYVVLNTGGAQFDTGDPITMTDVDVESVAQSSESKMILVHMDTVNHCRLTRTQMKAALSGADHRSRCIIPGDGDVLTL